MPGRVIVWTLEGEKGRDDIPLSCPCLLGFVGRLHLWWWSILLLTTKSSSILPSFLTPMLNKNKILNRLSFLDYYSFSLCAILKHVRVPRPELFLWEMRPKISPLRGKWQARVHCKQLRRQVAIAGDIKTLITSTRVRPLPRRNRCRVSASSVRQGFSQKSRHRTFILSLLFSYVSY